MFAHTELGIAVVLRTEVAVVAVLFLELAQASLWIADVRLALGTVRTLSDLQGNADRPLADARVRTSILVVALRPILAGKDTALGWIATLICADLTVFTVECITFASAIYARVLFGTLVTIVAVLTLDRILVIRALARVAIARVLGAHVAIVTVLLLAADALTLGAKLTNGAQDAVFARIALQMLVGTTSSGLLARILGAGVLVIALLGLANALSSDATVLLRTRIAVIAVLEVVDAFALAVVAGVLGRARVVVVARGA